MQLIRRCAGLTLALAMLWGCAAQHEAQPLSAAANARALEARALDDPRLRQFVAASRALARAPAPAGAWDLDSLSLAALYYHPDLDLARARLAAARAGVITAAQLPNPVATLGASYNGTTAVPSPWTVGLMVDFIVETFGKRGYREAEARHLADAARDDLADSTWQVRAGVRDALLGMWTAERRLTLGRHQLASHESLVRLLERRFAAGAVSALELGRGHIALDRARLALEGAERDDALAHAQLAQALGVPLRALDGVRISLDAFDAPARVPANGSKAELRAAALTRRTDVQALLAEYAAAQAALELQLARRWPDLRLGPGYTYDQGDHKYDLALGAELPLFSRNEGRIAAAEARRAEAAARFDALQARVIGAIDAAAARYRAAARSLGTADALVAQAGRRAAGYRRAFDAGALERAALVGAQIELDEARSAQLDARAAERGAVGALEDALRTPLFGSRGELPLEERNPRVASEDKR
jgi:cobalt-zinc-cadmium efflux system outer membrane protein